MHRQVRLNARAGTRRKIRTCVQVFQLSMLFFFTDQILKTYCSGRFIEGGQQAFLGQNVLKLARIPSGRFLNQLAHHLPSQWNSVPTQAAIAVWLAIAGFGILRINRAKFGELLAFGALLSGLMSNLITHSFAARTFDTLMLQLASDRYLAFNFADVCVLVGAFFVFRSLLLRVQLKWASPSRSAL